MKEYDDIKDQEEFKQLEGDEKAKDIEDGEDNEGYSNFKQVPNQKRNQKYYRIKL